VRDARLLPAARHADSLKANGSTRRRGASYALPLEMVCLTLLPGDCDDFKQTIATKLVALAKAGERSSPLVSYACPAASAEQVCSTVNIA
jgi:hypothetical protein